MEKLNVKAYIKKLHEIVKNTDPNKVIADYFALVHEHPEVTAYYPTGEEYACNGFAMNYGISTLDGALEEHDLKNDLADRKKNGKTDFNRRMGKSCIRIDREVADVVAKAKKNGVKLLQDVSIIRGNSRDGYDTQAKPLTLKTARNFVEAQADSAFLYFVENNKKDVCYLANSKEAQIYVEYIAGGLQDLKSELYREDHNTIPASHNYTHIEKLIDRDCRRYGKIVRVLKDNPKTRIFLGTVTPYKYVSSLGGHYHTLTTQDVRFIVSAIHSYPAPKPQKSVHQTSLF